MYKRLMTVGAEDDMVAIAKESIERMAQGL